MSRRIASNLPPLGNVRVMSAVYRQDDAPRRRRPKTSPRDDEARRSARKCSVAADAPRPRWCPRGRGVAMTARAVSAANVASTSNAKSSPPFAAQWRHAATCASPETKGSAEHAISESVLIALADERSVSAMCSRGRAPSNSRRTGSRSRRGGCTRPPSEHEQGRNGMFLQRASASALSHSPCRSRASAPWTNGARPGTGVADLQIKRRQQTGRDQHVMARPRLAAA